MTYLELLHPTENDPARQRFRVDFRLHRGVFELPQNGCLPELVGWLLQDLDRGWWGIFAQPRSMSKYGKCVLTDRPIAVIETLP